MKRAFYANHGLVDYHYPPDKAKEVMDGMTGILWLDIEKPEEEEYRFLNEELGFHFLAVEDCRDVGTPPKMEDYGDFLFFVFRGINYSSGQHALDTLGIRIFVTERVMVTVHQKQSRTIDEVYQRLEQNPKLMDSMETLFFTILDTLTDNMMPVIDHVEERLEDFQHKVFDKFSPAILEEIFELKKWVLRLKRFMIPQREIIHRLIHSAHPMFHGEWRLYLRDVLDHTEMVLDHLEIYEQLFPDAMNTYLNQVTHRMNEVMKMMSIIATLMLPLSFITGIFGMNFQQMPLVGDGAIGFWVTIGFMATLFLGMVVYFKRKDWF